MDLLPGVRSRTVDTDRLRMHVLEAGPADGTPVVLLHGIVSTGRFFEHVLARLPDRYRVLAPDMRGAGRTEAKPIDATRGVDDWADDTAALLAALGVEAPPHLAGWSTGGAAVARYAMARPVASLTLIDPVSPHGFGGTRLDGTPHTPDHAGTGGGTGSPEFAERMAADDRSAESPLSPRNMLNTSFWSPSHREPPEREDVLVEEVNRTLTGPDGYPGDLVASEHWPGFAPGTRGILNALSPRYLDWTGIVELDPKPPILWTHGSDDVVIADGSGWDLATLGQAGVVPGWPGPEAFPPQPMVGQIRAVLDRYEAAGGTVRREWFEGSGHFPPIDAAEAWLGVFTDFLAAADRESGK